MQNRQTQPERGKFTQAVFSMAVWMGFGLFASAMAYLQWSVISQDFRTRIPWRSMMPRSIAWGLLTPLIFAIDRGWLERLRLSRRIFLHAFPGILLSLIAVLGDFGMQVALESRHVKDTTLVLFVLENMPGAFLCYALIVGVSVSMSYGNEARRREQEAADLLLHSAQMKTHLAEARLQTLQSQLNPHFLFNTLNAISAFTDTDPKVARQMMARLGALLRTSLDHAARQEVTLTEELAFLEDYLAIERLRFEDRLVVNVVAEEGTRDAMVPSFALQPLVENAIRHGTGQLLHGGHVWLSSRRGGNMLRIRVEDDGVGLPQGWSLEDHAGVGLSNIARRLQELYGAEQEFAVVGRAEGGVRVELAFPFRLQPEGAAKNPVAAEVL